MTDIKRIAYEIEMRETHRKDRPWVRTGWAADAKTREEAFRLVVIALELNKGSPFRPEFRVLELLTTIIEVKP